MASTQYTNLYRLWKLFFLQSMVFVVLLVLAMIYYVKAFAIATEWGKLSLIGAGLSFLPSLPLLSRYREMFTSARGNLNEASSAAIRRLLVLGIMVADLPAIAGVVHYVVAGELAVMGGFCVVTCVIVFLYRPPRV